jgi:GNAT superfamily N-acetyltransferase
MNWAQLNQLAESMPVAAGYQVGMLRQTEVKALIALIRRWFPEVGVGSGARYLREPFYERDVLFENGPDADVVIAVFRHDDKLVGMFSFEHDVDTLSVHAQLSVALPEHRGIGVARLGMNYTEIVARRMGMGMIFGMATLRHPHVQRAFERAGWEPIGIAPGYDRELIAPGVVKRVYEAIYAKVLVRDDQMLIPSLEQMTPRTRALFSSMILDRRSNLERARVAEVSLPCT